MQLTTPRTLGFHRRTGRKGGINTDARPARISSRRSSRRPVGAGLVAMPRPNGTGSPMQAAFALPIGFFGMLLIGVVAIAGEGWFNPAVAVLTAVLVAVTAAVAEPLAAVPLAGIGWFTVAGFSRAPYGELHLHGTALPAVELAVV